MNKIPAAVPSPPQSPVRSAQEDVEHQLSDLSLFTKKWQPHFLTTLRPLENKVQIPTNAQTFHPQFLADALGGDDWSPGTKFIVAGDHTCIIRNRTYFLVDPATEPYLPAQAGHHGAKLIAFFNKTPEDFHELPEDVTSYENVPMFVKQLDGRFAYFGNYTQARWSDKLDNDTMRARVPQSIKEHWANELTSADRPEWVTKALKTHFFKKPEYEGRLYPEELDASTVTSEVEVKNNERMARDVRKYVEKLREWEREATMKTALIKKQVILDAFDAVSLSVRSGSLYGFADILELMLTDTGRRRRPACPAPLVGVPRVRRLAQGLLRPPREPAVARCELHEVGVMGVEKCSKTFRRRDYDFARTGFWDMKRLGRVTWHRKCLLLELE